MIRGYQHSIQSRLKWVLLTLLMMVVFGALSNYPVSILYVSLNTLALAVFAFFFAFLSLQSLKQAKFSRLYILSFLILLVPVIGAFQSYKVFGQPLIYGLLSERTKLFIVSGLLIVYALERSWVSLKEIEKTMVNVGLVYFLVGFTLIMFVPKDWISDFDFISLTQLRGYRLNINHGLYLALYFYSLIQVMRNFRVKFLILVILLFIYFAFIFKARALTLTVILVSLLMFFRHYSFLRILKIGTIFMLSLLFLFTISFIFLREELSVIVQLFVSAFNVFLGGEITDFSAQSRVFEYEIAKKGFLESPLFGNGFVSSRWNGGFPGMYGHFYPSDIGWIGLLFLYGLFGTLISVLPFIFSFKFALQKKKIENSFISALNYLYLYYFLSSLVGGYFVKKTGLLFFIFSLLYYYYYSSKKNTESIKKLD
ncbi:MAG: hypothetical protein RIC95_02880 [Vicingaceae bacterium]